MSGLWDHVPVKKERKNVQKTASFVALRAESCATSSTRKPSRGHAVADDVRFSHYRAENPLSLSTFCRFTLISFIAMRLKKSKRRKKKNKASSDFFAVLLFTSPMSSSDEMLPRVIVFDLDGTLWDPEMYELYGGAPFKPHRTNPSIMVDCQGTEVHLIGESRTVLQTLSTDPKWANTYLAISSTCDVPQWAAELLRKFTFTSSDGKAVTMGSLFGDRIEVYKANKAKQHQTILRKVQGVDPSVTEFSQMLFFDNQTDNVHYVSQIGVPSCYCSRGMTPGTFERGLEMWRKAQKSKM